MGRDRGRWPRKVQHAREELPPGALQCGLLHMSVLDRAVVALERRRSYQGSSSTYHVARNTDCPSHCLQQG